MKRGITVLNALVIVAVLVSGLLIISFTGEIFSEDISGKIIGNQTINMTRSQQSVTLPSENITQISNETTISTSPAKVIQPSENVTEPIIDITKPAQIIENITLPQTTITQISNETTISTTPINIIQPSEDITISEDITESTEFIEAINITPPIKDVTQMDIPKLNLLGKALDSILKSAKLKKNKVIDDCMVITSPGDYILTKDLTTGSLGKSGLCIIVDSLSNVHIDCRGYTIYGGSLVHSDLGLPNQVNSPLIYIKRSSDFSISNCLLNNDPRRPHSVLILIQDSLSGAIKDNIFNGIFKSIYLYNSNDIKIINNNLSIMSSSYSNNLFISKNNFTFQSIEAFPTTTGNLVFNSGSNNIIVDNFIDGKMNPCCNVVDKTCCSDLEISKIDKGGIPYKGSDDGIIFGEGDNYVITNNKIINSWDCGIETEGLISNSIISNNVLVNNALCGIGGWYNNGQDNNLFEDNRIFNSRFGFNFAYTPLPSLPSYNDGVIHFANNIFKNNIGSGVKEVNFRMGHPMVKVPDESIIIEGNIYDSNRFTFISPVKEESSELTCYPDDVIVGSNNYCRQSNSEYKCGKVDCI